VKGFIVNSANKIINEFRDREFYRWNSLMIMYEAQFRKHILELAENRKIIYDDGENILLDLSEEIEKTD
jgi:hypothetical protein